MIRKFRRPACHRCESARCHLLSTRQIPCDQLENRFHQTEVLRYRPVDEVLSNAHFPEAETDDRRADHLGQDHAGHLDEIHCQVRQVVDADHLNADEILPGLCQHTRQTPDGLNLVHDLPQDRDHGREVVETEIPEATARE